MGYDIIMIFGNPDNYIARGFKSGRKYNICPEGNRFPASLMVKELRESVLDERKWYFHESLYSQPFEYRSLIRNTTALLSVRYVETN